MLMKRWLRKLISAGSALVLLAASTPAFGQASLGQPCCGQTECCPSGCNMWHCPPKFTYCMEGPPKICVFCACPKPVCCPSDAPNWGYFQTCWRPYPWGPNWSHCYGNPPAAQVMVPGTTTATPGMPLPPGGDLQNQPSATRPNAPGMMVRPGV